MSSNNSLPHIFLIGASGRTGRILLDQAMSRGHTVTAILRNTATLQNEAQSASGNFSMIQGDPCNTAAIASALSQTLSSTHQPLVIISTLGQTRKSGNPWSAPTSPPRFMSQSASAIISAIERLDASSRERVQKFVIMSMFGAQDSFAQNNFLMRLIFQYSNMLQTKEDHDLIDKAVKGQDVVKFVMPRASMLKGDKALPVKTFGNEGKGAPFMPSISMPSVAGFLLDAAMNNEWDGKTPVIAN